MKLLKITAKNDCTWQKSVVLWVNIGQYEQNIGQNREEYCPFDAQLANENSWQQETADDQCHINST